jgi:hypothetical protein
VYRFLLVTTAFLLIFGSVSSQVLQTNDTLTVNFSVLPIQMFRLNTHVVDLEIKPDVSFGQPFRAQEMETINYDLICTAQNKRLVARLNNNMPHNTYLDIFVSPPFPSSSPGYVRLSTAPQTVLSGISNVSTTGQSQYMHLRFTAELGARVNTREQVRVYFTLQD